MNSSKEKFLLNQRCNHLKLTDLREILGYDCSFALSFHGLMETRIIYISDGVIKDVVKTESLMISEIEVGTTFTLEATDMVNSKGEIDIVKSKEVVTYPVFKYRSSKGGLYKFTTFDLRNFTQKDISFDKYFVPRAGERCAIQHSFTVTKVTALVDSNGDKRYPPFFYPNFEEYKKAKLAEGVTHPTAEMLKLLHAEPIPEHMENRY